MSLAQAFAAEFDHEIGGTRKHIANLTDDQLGWKPHEKSFTTGQLANHLVNILDWLRLTAEADSFDLEPPGEEPWRPPELMSVKEILAAFDAKVPTARGSLLAIADEDMYTTWSLLKAGEVMMAMPRIACVRSFILNHMIHHRAQLGVYLRMNDLPVPSVYGPSADDAG